MKPTLTLLTALLLAPLAALHAANREAAQTGVTAEMTLAEKGQAKAVIALVPEASLAEKTAASELAKYLKEVSGAEFAVVAPAEAAGKPMIAVGPGAAKAIAPDLDLAKAGDNGLGDDGIVLKTVTPHLVLTGAEGAKRGTLYAVYEFLEREVGVRWWTPDAETVPGKPTLAVGPLGTRYKPPFLYRETHFARVMGDKNAAFAAKLRLNGHFQGIPPGRGGHYDILGWCHTFFSLLPPQTYYKEHPEWYSEVGGKRVHEQAQLCLTNDEMKQELVRQALAWIKKNPAAGMISISQNDCHGACQCANCQALAAKTGSQSGVLLTFVNAVAAEIEKQHPDFLVETLAYQYTRKPPANVRPRDNVVIRLCSIESDFAVPLAAAENQSFYRDLQDWKKIAGRLFIWDYVVNFQNLLIPHPNFQVLGDNLRLFAANHVIGMFEQGDGYNPDAAFASLKTWVLSKLMWDPRLDERQLIHEYLAGYYGAAAPGLAEYLDVMQKAVADEKAALPCFYTTPKFYTPRALGAANQAMSRAESAVQDKPELLRRVRLQKLALQHLLMITKRICAAQQAPVPGVDWPGLAKDYLELSDATGNIFREEGRPMTAGYRQELRAKATAPSSLPKAPTPARCQNLGRDEWRDLQEGQFALFGEGQWVNVVNDANASDGMAAVMPGNSPQWAVQLQLMASDVLTPTVAVFASVKVKAKAKTGPAFAWGVHDYAAGRAVVIRTVSLAEVADAEYHEYSLGEVAWKPGMSIWFAPPNDGNRVESVAVDRVYIEAVREKAKP